LGYPYSFPPPPGWPEGTPIVNDDEGEWDTQTNDDGLHRWVWTNAAGAEYIGPRWYQSRSTAIRAGREWLKEWRRQA
jgi:hypothetical protein